MGSIKRSDIVEFFEQRRITLVGVSKHEGDFSRHLMKDLQVRGFEVLPVNPTTTEIDGLECYKRLTEIENPPSAAFLMTRSESLIEPARDCALVGLRMVWVLRSAGDRTARNHAIRVLEENLITVIDGFCPYLFLPGVELPHRIHRGIAGFFGQLPR